MSQGPFDLTLDPLASPLRQPRVARALAWSLGVLLVLASLVICAVVAGLGSAATAVFVRALALSSAMSLLPILILWYLDRRERESRHAFAAAFLWGGLIATTLALPLNTAAIMAVTQWLEQFPELGTMLGPDAAMMIGAPLSAPIVEETTKGIGIVLLFWLLRGEFDNVRDGFIYGALIGAGFNWFESALYACACRGRGSHPAARACRSAPGVTSPRLPGGDVRQLACPQDGSAELRRALPDEPVHGRGRAARGYARRIAAALRFRRSRHVWRGVVAGPHSLEAGTRVRRTAAAARCGTASARARAGATRLSKR